MSTSMLHMTSYSVQHLLVYVLLAAKLHPLLADCYLPIVMNLPSVEPLILLPDGSFDVFGFKLPSSRSALKFAEDEQVRLVCVGANNAFRLFPEYQDIVVTCMREMFVYEDTRASLRQFGCARNSKTTARKTPALCNNGKNRITEIGFDVSDTEFYTLIELCFDQRTSRALWSRIDIVNTIEDGEAILDSPNTFRKVKGAKTHTISTSKDSTTILIDKYIENYPEFTKFRISWQHLSDHGDFVYNVQRNATYYFINGAPQWLPQHQQYSTWQWLETSIRNYAHMKQVHLVVYTGPHGTAKLTLNNVTKEQLFDEQDSDNENVDDTAVSVPLLFWKVVYNPVNGRGIAFVGVNNPFVNIEQIENDQEYQLCSNKITVPFWRFCEAYHHTYQDKGFGYCCSISELRKRINYLPALTVLGILE